MNKHMRAKVSACINNNAVAVHRVSDVAVIRATPCSPTMTLRKSDGTPDEWLSPSDTDSTKYKSVSTLAGNECPVVAIRYNWRAVFQASVIDENIRGSFPPLGYSQARTQYFMLGRAIECGGINPQSEIFISDNPFLFRSFVAKLLKLRVVSLYRVPEYKNILFATHHNGCYRIEHNGNGIITSIRDVRIGEKHDGSACLRQRSECLDYLYDIEGCSLV